MGGFLDENTYIVGFLLDFGQREIAMKHGLWLFCLTTFTHSGRLLGISPHLAPKKRNKAKLKQAVKMTVQNCDLATKNSNLMIYKQICTSIYLNNYVSYFTCMDLSIQTANNTFKPRIKPLKRQLGFGLFDSVPCAKDISHSHSSISNFFLIYKFDRNFKSYKSCIIVHNLPLFSV